MRSAFGSLEVFISPPLAVAAESVPHPLACRSVARRTLGIGLLFAANGKGAVTKSYLKSRDHHIGILSFEVNR
jgi:hypothetical protein